MSMEIVRDYAVASLRMAAPASPIARRCMVLYHRTGWVITLNTFLLLGYLSLRVFSLNLVLVALIFSIIWSFHFQFKYNPRKTPYLYLDGYYGADSSLYHLAFLINTRFGRNLSAPLLSIAVKVVTLIILGLTYLLIN